MAAITKPTFIEEHEKSNLNEDLLAGATVSSCYSLEEVLCVLVVSMEAK